MPGAAVSARSVSADRCRPRPGLGNLRQQRLRRKLPGPRRGRRRPGAAVRPLEHLLLVGERDAGDGHDEDDDAGDSAACEVHPEQNGAKASSCEILRLGLNF